MAHPHGKHPYTGRVNTDYLTLVVERIKGRTPDSAMRDALFNSLASSEECTALPGFRVTAIAVGDELSEQEARDTHDEED